MMKMLIRSVNYQVGETAAAAAARGFPLRRAATATALAAAACRCRMAAAETMKGYSHVVTS